MLLQCHTTTAPSTHYRTHKKRNIFPFPLDRRPQTRYCISMLTHHAIIRMAQRSITIGHIIACITSGELEQSARLPWRAKITDDRGVCVVVDTIRHTIVTVYRIEKKSKSA